jgi:hypothetical protein
LVGRVDSALRSAVGLKVVGFPYLCGKTPDHPDVSILKEAKAEYTKLRVGKLGGGGP